MTPDDIQKNKDAAVEKLAQLPTDKLLIRELLWIFARQTTQLTTTPPQKQMWVNVELVKIYKEALRRGLVKEGERPRITNMGKHLKIAWPELQDEK